MDTNVQQGPIPPKLDLYPEDESFMRLQITIHWSSYRSVLHNYETESLIKTP
jgi:hypothetical protein